MALTLPEDHEAERILLATLCAPGAERTAAELLPRLSQDHFLDPAHRSIYTALSAIVHRGEELSPISLRVALQHDGSLERLGGWPKLVEILSADEVSRPEYLVERLGGLWKARTAIKLASRLAQEASAGISRIEDTIDEAVAGLVGLVVDARKAGLDHVSSFSSPLLDQLIEEHVHGKRHGLRLGFERLDRLTRGLQPGNLIILAARPGIGKTSLALNWIYESSMQGKTGAFFSLEMTREEVLQRLWKYAGWKTTAAWDPRSPEQYLPRIRQHVDGLPIHICDQAAITVREIGAMADRYVTQNGHLDFLVVDYLQLISSPEGSRGSKQTEAVRVAEISRALKLLAKDHGIPVVVLSQLNREVEHRQNSRPQLSDLRDSGALEQDADMVLFIARKAIPTNEPTETTEAELIVAKHRNGPTALIPMEYLGHRFAFREVERTTDPVEPRPMVEVF